MSAGRMQVPGREWTGIYFRMGVLVDRGFYFFVVRVD